MIEYTLILNKFKPQIPAMHYVPAVGLVKAPAMYVPIVNAMSAEGSVRYDQMEALEQYKYVNSKDAKVFSSQFFGVPVFCDLVLEQTGTGESIQLLQVLITSNNNGKNIVKTTVQGRAGTVKEYISDGDYDLSIQGGLFDSNKSRYPLEEARKLARMCAVPEALKVISPWLNDVFDIHYLVITGRDFPQSEGKQNVQLYNIKAISDDAPEINISNA